ncbi:MAG: GTPase Era [Clostridiales bacterium]|nr:GTPase Era [Clostridiales bacterium]
MLKSAFITIAGKPNVGKSTILNSLIGAKVSIVSPKPQTTRTKIMGIVTDGDTQLVFTDTPGFHNAKNKLGDHMNTAVGDSISGTDAILFVVEPQGQLNEREMSLIEKFSHEKAPVILAINKIDLLKDKRDLLPHISYLAGLYDFAAVVPVSAKKNTGISELMSEMKKFASEDVHYFDDDALTDQSERALAGEIIREKLLLYTDREVPHGIAVSVEKMHVRENREIMDIEAVIYCERKTHTSIIIGSGGDMIKRISTAARAEIEKFFGIQVNLQLWVKLKENWRNREGLIHNFGLD